MPTLKRIIRVAWIVIASSIMATTLPGCMTLKKRMESKTATEVMQWSDEYLCTNAYWDNPAIKSELLKRQLLNEDEYDYLVNGDSSHHNWPKPGMRKCAIWTFTNGGELVNKTLEGRKVLELWKVHKGEYIIFKSTGGRYLWVTIENDRIVSVTNVSDPPSR
jgi:hypothetical protein